MHRKFLTIKMERSKSFESRSKVDFYRKVKVEGNLKEDATSYKTELIIRFQLQYSSET